MRQDRGQITGEALMIALAAALVWFLGAEAWAGLKWFGVHAWALLKHFPH